ncbi:hypothetical protein BpHYR1_049796 [Brachionus plicatilis]|uniref:Uncharacterized protein n=1 Tax=Brachionus plicatilis TaxID=10195 RepID=A0A3M7RLN2_BRAPC|nr:hypothetical protein BpHYR1_049796 [Brachionus plicatilis]
MESVIGFKCFQVPMDKRVDYLKDNEEEKQELFLFIQTNGGTERGRIGRQRFVKSRKHPGEGSLFMGMNGWLLDIINHRAINKKSYRANEEGPIIVGAPISGVTMSTPSNVQAAGHLLPSFLATLDVIPTSASPVRAPAPVDPTPALVLNVNPRVVVQLDSENIFRCLNLGRGRTLHLSRRKLDFKVGLICFTLQDIVEYGQDKPVHYTVFLRSFGPSARWSNFWTAKKSGLKYRGDLKNGLALDDTYVV